ncbi:MAG TPA: hypothetical protein DCE56_02465 [Cyanobacteria bacterium UBA8553]|nr:hypothetical protein [Cyanobacteria bacterium UBA8553]
MKKDVQSQLWQTVEILFDHFTDKPTYTRQELAQGLGDVHFNTIYKDELLLLEWCEPYGQSLRRRQRLQPYQVWLLVLARVLVHHYGRSEAIAFFFNNSESLTLEKFDQFRRERNERINKAKRIFAA